MLATTTRRSLTAALVIAACAATPAAADGPTIPPELRSAGAAPSVVPERVTDASPAPVQTSRVDLRSADGRDGRAPVAPLPTSVSQPVAVADDGDGFSWPAAAIGGALTVVLLGGFVLVSRRRHHIGGPALHA